MIDRSVFTTVWAKLCRRFGRAVDREEAADYLAYLEAAGLSTEEVRAAAHALWATREFFPRPGDFLQPQAVSGWSALRSMAALPTREYSTDQWWEARAKVPDRAWKALHAIGGLDAIRNARDLISARREYLAAYEAQVQEEAMRKALPAPDGPKLLPGAA